MIEIRSLNYSYNRKRALTDINLSLSPPGIVAVLGPNGAGKSTLLNAIVGLLPIEVNSVNIDGLDRRIEDARIRPLIAYVPDHPHLIPKITGREYLAFVAECYEIPTPVAERRIEEVARVMGIGDHLQAFPNSLSRGQAKRISLAAALITDAQLFVFDEPFAGGLDPNGQAALKACMTELATERGALVVFATQVPEIAQERADQILIMHESCLCAQGTLQEVEAQYGVSGEGLTAVFTKVSGLSLPDVKGLFRSSEPELEREES
jgi:ABC-2 type transport system ATP-binding protein